LPFFGDGERDAMIGGRSVAVVGSRLRLGPVLNGDRGLRFFFGRIGFAGP